MVLFINRQYHGYAVIGKKSALLQWRMGLVLCRLRDQCEHGEWLPFLDATFAFTARTATTWMRLAESATLQEATDTPATELMQAKGIIPYRKEKPPKEEGGAEDNGTDDGEGDGMADLKLVGNKVARITTVARELQEKVSVLPPNSYNSNEKHAAFLKDFAKDIRAAILDLYRAIVQMREFVKSSNDAALADALTSLDDAKEVLAVLDQPILKPVQVEEEAA